MKLRAWRAAAALLFLAPALARAQEQGDSASGADAVSGLSAPVPINSLAAPLSGPGFLTDAPASLSRTALPPSALNAAAPQAAASDVAPQTAALTPHPMIAAPAAADNAPEAAPAAAQPAAPPYFVSALVKLGAPADLARQLSDYQLSRHPGGQNPLYHGLGHSQDVPNLTALSLNGLPEGSLTDSQKALLITAAAFHDIDPLRRPGTPPGVARTRGYLASDPRSRRLLEDLSARFGFTPAQVLALIDATDFSPDPEEQKRLQAVFEDSVRQAFPDEASRQWALLWGRRLSFFDKSAAYVGGPKSAERQVLALADELRAAAAAAGKAGPTDRQMIDGTPSFLKALRSSPDFALLPPAAQANFAAVSKHFELKARGLPSPYDAEGTQSRGPPTALNEAARAQARALSEARTQAQEALGLPSLPGASAAGRAQSNPLSALKNGSFAVLSPGQVPDFHLESRILAAIDKSAAENPGSGFWQWAFLEEGGREWRTNKKQPPELVADVRSFVEGLTRELQAALPDENIAIRDVQIRVNPPPETGAKLHVDGGYITLTCALRGPGTVIYD
ncbi:MAG: hypothetical protein KGI84_09460, partial [Elusimicrobia bacterium]|nr:hypothetical protein [Elusimicrobiota bacterium]